MILCDGLPPLRICLDARLHDGQHGGVQQVVIGLATALSALEPDDEQYHFLVTPEAGRWIRPWLGGACQMLEAPEPRRVRRPGRMLREWRARAGASFVRVPTSDGTIERAGIDVMHFTVQTAFRTSVPSVYHPHDLQHLHMPHLFDPRELAERTATYRQHCLDARMVVALSTWGQRDVMQAYGLTEDRVRVVPNAPVLGAYRAPTAANLTDTRRRLSLPARYLFYPAATWPHKNHIALLDAMALLRDRDRLAIPLVCSGLQTDHFSAIAAHVDARGLTDQVQFVGWVNTLDLRGLYAGAHALVFPSLFEGFGIPVAEAFEARVPVACSNVTCLPDLARGAAELFDPADVNDMAGAIARVWGNTVVRGQLASRARSRVGDFSWDRSARLLRAHYRRIANRPLNDEDQALLSAPAPL